MVRAGVCVAAGVFAVAAAWVGVAHFAPVGAAQPDAKPVDLTALRDAVGAASRRGENVDEIRKALDAYERSSPKAAGRVTNELQALRDAVDAAARKGENVEAIAKELARVETAAAGRELARPKPQPQPDPRPPAIAPELPPGFPNQFFPDGGGIDVALFNKVMELRQKAVDLKRNAPNDPEALKEARKLEAEATELMFKAARGLAGGGAGGLPAFPNFPDLGRLPDRARLGIRLERVAPVAAEQLGLEPDTGIAVTFVVAGSVAEKVGLKVHDIVLEFAGKAVTDNTEEFVRRVNAVRADEKVNIVVMRKGKKVEMKGVELPAVPARVPPAAGAIPNIANPFLKAAEALNGGGGPIKPLNPLNPIPNLPPVAPNPLPLRP